MLLLLIVKRRKGWKFIENKVWKSMKEENGQRRKGETAAAGEGGRGEEAGGAVKVNWLQLGFLFWKIRI